MFIRCHPKDPRLFVALPRRLVNVRLAAHQRLYLAWTTGEARVVRWELSEGAFVELPPDSNCLLKSHAFPGLWLDAAALVRGDLRGVLETLRHGLSSSERGGGAGKEPPPTPPGPPTPLMPSG